MEAKQTFKVGERVEQMCLTCNEERGHIVASLSKAGKITRVSCPICGSRSPYKVGAGPRTSGKVAAPYDRTRTYRKGQMLMHPTFGEGEVTAIIEPQKMDVLFSDRIRRLIHAHTSM
jgi:transcription elongation factor Elf1